MRQDQPILQVLPVAGADWARHRAIRMPARADFPERFGATWANEPALPESTWRERAVPTADQQMWLADRGEEWAGLVGAIREADASVQLISMWVDPAWRRQGVARGPDRGGVAWHRLVEGSELYLWVSADNPGARRGYEADGFRLTGARLPPPADPVRDRLQMRLGDRDAPWFRAPPGILEQVLAEPLAKSPPTPTPG